MCFGNATIIGLVQWSDNIVLATIYKSALEEGGKAILVLQWSLKGSPHHLNWKLWRPLKIDFQIFGCAFRLHCYWDWGETACGHAWVRKKWRGMNQVRWKQERRRWRWRGGDEISRKRKRAGCLHVNLISCCMGMQIALMLMLLRIYCFCEAKLSFVQAKD